MTRFLICDDAQPILTVPICEKYGFGIEIQSFYDPSLLDRDPTAVEVHLQLTSKIALRATHGCFGDLCPGSFDPMVRSVARSRFDLSYDFACKLNAAHLILHHGYVPHTSPPDRWLRRCTTFWKQFLKDRQIHILIHIENMLDWEPGLLADLIDAIGNPFVDANLDVGHVHCNSKVGITEWILRLGKRIGYVHLHDNHGTDDEHLALGKGSIPLKETLSMLMETAPDAFWGIEPSVNGIEESIGWLMENGFCSKTAQG